VKEVLLPADNEPNAKADLPPELLGDLKITYVRTLDEVIEQALEKEPVAPPVVPSAGPKRAPAESPRAIH
jgi:ATP-dependent Lon protease